MKTNQVQVTKSSQTYVETAFVTAIENYIHFNKKKLFPEAKEETFNDNLNVNFHAVLSGNLSAELSPVFEQALKVVEKTTIQKAQKAQKTQEAQEVIILTDYRKYLLLRYDVSNTSNLWQLYNIDPDPNKEGFHRSFSKCSALKDTVLKSFVEHGCFTVILSTIENLKIYKEQYDYLDKTIKKQIKSAWDSLISQNLRSLFSGEGGKYIFLNYRKFGKKVKKEIITYSQNLNSKENKSSSSDRIETYLKCIETNVILDLSEIRETISQFIKNDNLEKLFSILDVDLELGVFAFWSVLIKNKEILLRLIEKAEHENKYDVHDVFDRCYSFLHALVNNPPSPALSFTKSEAVDLLIQEVFLKRFLRFWNKMIIEKKQAVVFEDDKNSFWKIDSVFSMIIQRTADKKNKFFKKRLVEYFWNNCLTSFGYLQDKEAAEELFSILIKIDNRGFSDYFDQAIKKNKNKASNILRALILGVEVKLIDYCSIMSSLEGCSPWSDVPSVVFVPGWSDFLLWSFRELLRIFDKKNNGVYEIGLIIDMLSYYPETFAEIFSKFSISEIKKLFSLEGEYCHFTTSFLVLLESSESEPVFEIIREVEELETAVVSGFLKDLKKILDDSDDDVASTLISSMCSDENRLKIDFLSSILDEKSLKELNHICIKKEKLINFKNIINKRFFEKRKQSRSRILQFPSSVTIFSPTADGNKRKYPFFEDQKDNKKPKSVSDSPSEKPKTGSKINLGAQVEDAYDSQESDSGENDSGRSGAYIT